MKRIGYLLPTNEQRKCGNVACAQGSYSLAQIAEALEFEGFTSTQAMDLVKRLYANTLQGHDCLLCTPRRMRKIDFRNKLARMMRTAK